MAQLELAINELMIVSDGADLVAEKLSRVARALEQWNRRGAATRVECGRELI
jgi:hypothetical protein